MKLTVLGSGTCVPNKNRGSSGYLLEIDDKKILLDCGNGTTWKLEKIGISYLDIDYIFITHFHPDHTADLIPFLFATKYPYPYKEKREKKLSIYGPKGFTKFYQNMKNLYGDWVSPHNVETKEIGKKLQTEDFTIKTFKTVHTENSIGYKIFSGNKKLVYTGDTGYFEELSEISDKVDLLVIECALPDKERMKIHLSPGDIIKIFKNSIPKKVLLTHLYSSMENIDLISLINNKNETEFIIANDLMEIEL